MQTKLDFIFTTLNLWFYKTLNPRNSYSASYTHLTTKKEWNDQLPNKFVSKKCNIWGLLREDLNLRPLIYVSTLCQTELRNIKNLNSKNQKKKKTKIIQKLITKKHKTK